jgi:5-methylcytosine-specific restriction endonuclease McrA
MPVDYKKYHPEWKTRIRPDILRRANNSCEECGLMNYEVILRTPTGCRNPCPQEWDMIYSRIKYSHSNMTESLKYHGFTKIVLTIAHLDHNVENNDYDNLKALCQRCHLRYDAKMKGSKRRNASKTLELFV